MFSNSDSSMFSASVGILGPVDESGEGNGFSYSFEGVSINKGLSTKNPLKPGNPKLITC